MDSTLQITPSNQLGAPSKYMSEYCSQIADIAASGGHIPSMMLKIGIKSKDTWYRWQKEYPEFKQAVEEAELISQAFYEDIGLKGMMGQIPNFNSTLYIHTVCNKFGKDYKRNPTSTEINITNNTLNLTPDQVKQKIAQVSERLKSIGQDVGVDIEHVS